MSDHNPEVQESFEQEIEVDPPVPIKDLSEDEASRQQKQTYLYIHVVEKGYDTDVFATFMNSKKGKSASF